jgi:hypothetical protein
LANLPFPGEPKKQQQRRISPNAHECLIWLEGPANKEILDGSLVGYIMRKRSCVGGRFVG